MVFGSGLLVFFFQAEDGIRDLVRSRGLGDVYKRQVEDPEAFDYTRFTMAVGAGIKYYATPVVGIRLHTCLLYTSDAADERSSVDLGGRRIIKKKTKIHTEKRGSSQTPQNTITNRKNKHKTRTTTNQNTQPQ